MNENIINQFELLLKQIKVEYINAKIDNDVKELTMHQYRLNSVRKILGILKKLDFEIKDANELKGIAGIGVGTRNRIKEILETGELSEIDNTQNKNVQPRQGVDRRKLVFEVQAINELAEIIGIGEEIAKKLVSENKITSINGLKRAYKKGEIELNDKILLGLKYYGVVEGNIPRKEIEATGKYLERIIHKISPDLEITICGSYRRGKATSGDIDVLMYSSKIKTKADVKKSSYLKLFIEDLTDDGFILDGLAEGKMKYMGFSKFKKNPVRRLDIRFVPYESLYTALVYFTGPFELNTEMRRKAKKLDMKLNEYGIYLDNKMLKVKSEKDVFKHLGMKYLDPEERESYSNS